MNVKIEGKEERKGTSKKTGKDYHFIVLHFLSRKAGVDGQAAYEKLLDPSVLDYDHIQVGTVYDLEVDLTGNIVSMEIAKK